MVDEVHSMNLVFLANFGAKYENREWGKQILNLSAVERPLKKCGLCVAPVTKKSVIETSVQMDSFSPIFHIIMMNIRVFLTTDLTGAIISSFGGHLGW